MLSVALHTNYTQNSTVTEFELVMSERSNTDLLLKVHTRRVAVPTFESEAVTTTVEAVVDIMCCNSCERTKLLVQLTELSTVQWLQ